MDERGKVVKEALAAFLDGAAQGASAVLEAGRNWPVMYHWLEELVEEVTLAHPAKVRVIAEAKVKADRIDSRMLAHLLRADLIPAAYVPGPVTREQGRRLRQRMFLVRLSTMVKNRLHTLIDRHPELAVLYQRLKVAKVAVAKRLLTIAYQVLNEGWAYRPSEEQARLKRRRPPGCPDVALADPPTGGSSCEGEWGAGDRRLRCVRRERRNVRRE